ncbi:voltage-gated purine nucleotide uniporter SLC17A9-like [Styela clava]
MVGNHVINLDSKSLRLHSPRDAGGIDRIVKKQKGSNWSKSEEKTWIATLFIGTTILFSSRVAMPVCAPAMAKEFGWNKEHLGTVMGCFFWGYAMTQIFGGYMADRIGGDRMLCIAALTWGTVTFITPYIAYLYDDHTVTLLLLGLFRVILGLFQGMHYPSMTSLVSRNVCEKDRSFAMGVTSTGSNFGSLLCGGIGSVILESHGWPGVFYFVGLCAFGWVIHSWQLSKTQQGRKVTRQNSVEAKEDVPWRLIFSKSQLWCAICAHFCMNASYFILLMWLPTYFHERFPDQKAWVFNVVPWLMSLPTSIFGGWLSKNIIEVKFSVTFARKFIQTIAMFGCGLFAMLLPFCENYISALIVAGLAVSCQTFHNSGILVNPQDIAPTYSGSVFGIMNTAGAIPGFLGVYMAGFILNASGNWKTVFTSVFVTNVIGLSIFLYGGTGEKII